jgi:hypothetical protein
MSSGLTSPSVGTSLQIGEEALDRVREVERLLVHDHELLLDPKRVRGARESVLHRARRV